MNISFEKQLENVRVIDSTRDYWFIRTFGGALFNEFIENNYVGIGFNNIPYNIIKEYNNTESSFKTIQSFINMNTKYKNGEATKWANQLISFEHNIKEGDLVLIPSKYSDDIAIGIIKSRTYLVKDKGTFVRDGVNEELPEKRKKIEWLRTCDRSDIQSEIRSITSSHQAVTNANFYSDYIESSLTNIYIKEEKIHLTIQVNQDNDINAYALNNFLSSITYFYREFCIDNNIDPDEDLTIKIKLQSKGKMALKALIPFGIIGIAGLIVLSGHSKVDLKIGDASVKGESDGLIPTITDFLNKKQERQIKYEIFKDSMEKLKATINKPDTNHDLKNK